MAREGGEREREVSAPDTGRAVRRTDYVSLPDPDFSLHKVRLELKHP
jgi:hypothetical protein